MRALEFYSGIGGMHYALVDVVPHAEVVCAFDINEVANDVYAHNFGRRPRQGNLQAVPARVLDGYRADIWLMAPPCQPYTRRGLQKDSADKRAASFLDLLKMLPTLQNPPEYLLVENVVGFGSSRTRQHLWETLTDAGYAMQEFLLSPLQFGIPYSRPRYFALARRANPALPNGGFAAASLPSGQPFMCPPALLETRAAEQGDSPASASTAAVANDAQLTARIGPLQAAAASEGPLGSLCDKDDSAQTSSLPSTGPIDEDDGDDGAGVSTQDGSMAGFSAEEESRLPRAAPLAPLRDFLVADPAAEGLLYITSDDRPGWAPNAKAAAAAATAADGRAEGQEASYPERGAATASSSSESGALSSEAAGRADPWELYRVPQKVWRSNGEVFDIVTPESTRCCCFTKTYSRYAKGSGSMLATRNWEQHLRDPQRPILCPSSGLQQAPQDPPPISKVQAQQPREPVQGFGQFGGPADRVGAVPSPPSLNGGEEEQGVAASYAEELGAFLASLELRYFTPREIANLHGLPPSFSFPPQVTLRQRYALLGNSLSARVVAELLRYLLRGSPHLPRQ